MSGPSSEDVLRELACYLRPGPGPVGDPAVGWAPVLDLAAEHRLLPALWSALHGRGVRPLPDGLDEDGTAPLTVLHHAHVANRERLVDLQAQAVLALDVFEEAGVPALPIKGTHWLLADLLEDPAARVMVDVDVLVPASRGAEAAGLLADVGFAPAQMPQDAEPAPHQLTPMRGMGRRGSLEVHVAPLLPRRIPVLEGEQLFAAAVDVDSDDLLVADDASRRRRRQVPDAVHAGVLLVAHAQLQDAGARQLQVPLRGLVDLANLRHGGRLEVDWAAVAAHFRAAGPAAAMAFDGFVAAAGDLFEVELPVEVGAAGRRWWRSVLVAGAHPVAARRYREAAALPHALRAERMRRLYGARSGPSLALARLRHLGAGAARRLSRP